MDDGLNCERDVPGNTRQTNALSFYSLGNEVDKGRSRTASLIYKSIVIGTTDKLHISSRTSHQPVFSFYVNSVKHPRVNSCYWLR